MTSVITSVTNSTYNSPLILPYTGTAEQPDRVSIFYKNAQNEILINDEAISNEMSYDPLNFRIAIWRAQEAAYRIFLYIKGEGNDLWNAVQNLTRACVSLVPLVGNATLYLYDSVKTPFYTHPQLKSEVANISGPVVGIAFDGKIVTSFTLETFSRAMRRQSNQPVDEISYIWFNLVHDGIERDKNITRLKLAQNLATTINENRLKG